MARKKGRKKLTVKQLHMLVAFLITTNILLLIGIMILAILLAKRKDPDSDDVIPKKDYVVCIDPGHGGTDVGALGVDGRYEKDDNLKLSLAVAKELRKSGIQVVLTRSDDSTVSLDERSNIANDANAELFVSLHRNQAASNTAQGVEVWIHTSASDKSYSIASSILEAMEDVGISQNRGVRIGTQGDTDSNYAVIRQTNMTSMIVETGFVSNEEDLELFDEHLDEYADAIADAIVRWLNEYAN